MIWLLWACRADPGAPVYPEREPWSRGEDDGFLSTPLADGELRLGIGLFYEGETTEFIPIDDTTSHFYVYEGSFGVEVSDDRVEGYTSDLIVLQGKPWWGGGVHWDAPHDLRAYDTLRFSLRAEAFGDWTVGMTGGAEHRVSVSSLGFVADGNWHTVELPLSTLSAAGVDLSAVTLPLLLIGEGGEADDEMWIDDLYLKGSEP
jgi:hypothetical protein